MRKLLFFLMLGVGITSLTSCDKVYEQYYTVPNKTIYATKQVNDWVTSDNGYTYGTSIALYDSDNFYNDYDGILIYVSYDNKTWEQIPQTYEGIAYSYTTTNERLGIEIQSSNFDTQVNPPGTIYFKIVLIPSQE